MGLDKPLIEQYCNWIGNIVFHGDFGDSLISNEPVSDMMWSKFGNTFDSCILRNSNCSTYRNSAGNDICN